MSGIDRFTGRPLGGFDEVVQSIGTIFSTRIGERCQRRWFGSIGPSLLGRLLTGALLLRFMAVMAVAIDLLEPRFKVSRFITGSNSADAVRLGHFDFLIEGEYRPRAHLGDLSSEGVRVISFRSTGSSYSLSAKA